MWFSVMLCYWLNQKIKKVNLKFYQQLLRYVLCSVFTWLQPPQHHQTHLTCWGWLNQFHQALPKTKIWITSLWSRFFLNGSSLSFLQYSFSFLIRLSYICSLLFLFVTEASIGLLTWLNHHGRIFNSSQ